MKTLYSLLLFCISLTLTAQNLQEKAVGEFKEIKVYDRIEVELIKSDENKVVVSGKKTEDVVVVHKKDLLKIRMTLEEAFDGDDTSIKVYYTSLDIIDANEGTFIGSKEVIEQF